MAGRNPVDTNYIVEREKGLHGTFIMCFMERDIFNVFIVIMGISTTIHAETIEFSSSCAWMLFSRILECSWNPELDFVNVSFTCYHAVWFLTSSEYIKLSSRRTLVMICYRGDKISLNPLATVWVIWLLFF